MVPLHVEGLLGNVVVLAFHDFLEAADGIGQLHVFAGEAGELLRPRGRAAKGTSGSCARGHGQLVFVRQLVDAQNGDDVLQVFVALQNPFTCCATS